MIPFEKVAGRWKGGGFLRESDQGSADCQRSVDPRSCSRRARQEHGHAGEAFSGRIAPQFIEYLSWTDFEMRS